LIYIGPVASADTVMKSGQHRDEIARIRNGGSRGMGQHPMYHHQGCV
jgi:hypothetical protein